MSAGSAKLITVDFEIFGRVQGVFFRKYTQKTATQNGLVGWVKNTRNDTVVGQMQGPEDKIKLMKDWLRKTGSPKSRIDRSVFKNEEEISKLSHKDFVVKK